MLTLCAQWMYNRRIKKGEMHMAKSKINISLDEEVSERLKKLAVAQHMTVSALITMWVLNSKEDETGMTKTNENYIDVMRKKAKQYYDYHKYHVQNWTDGEISKIWIDENNNFCIEYQSGSWWHYNDMGEWW